MNSHFLSRRAFARNLALSAATMALPSVPWVAQAASETRRKIIAFSKPFQNFTPDETADLVAEIGWDGIECPVRKNGHVSPDRVEEDLPKMADALKKRGLELTMITTDIRNATDPLNEKVLRTAGKLGVKHYRLSYWKYKMDRPVPDQLKRIRAELKELVDLNRQVGICGGFQNHSGSDYVGAPVWDIYELIKDFDSRYLGCCFDIGHATLEGGYSWPVQAHLMKPFVSVYYVKDFLWTKKGGGPWRADWCPLGEGMVQSSFFKQFKDVPPSIPVSQHHEYPLEGRKEMVTAMKKDLEVLRKWLV